MASPDQQEGSAFRPGYAEVSGFVRAPSRQPKRIQDMQPLPGEVVRYIVGSHGELRRITVEDVLIAALTRGRPERAPDLAARLVSDPTVGHERWLQYSDRAGLRDEGERYLATRTDL
jgi:hypothetical protein